MSELITTQSVHANARWQLLTTVSALAICGTIYTNAAAKADDADRPTAWIELGGQLERVQASQGLLLPPFLQTQPRPDFEDTSPASTQRPPRYAVGGEAKAIFAPEGSDWSFLAAIRFGRSNGSKELHQQSTTVRPSGQLLFGGPFYTRLIAFGHTQAAHTESHAVVDFMAGTDVGLGILGNTGAATFNFGVRFAQFHSRSSANLREVPDPFLKRVPHPNPFLPNFHLYQTYRHHHSYYAQENTERSFSGIGPSISLTGSSSLVGTSDTLGVAVDWGANAALLFGRQKVRGSYNTAGYFISNHFHSSAAPKSSYSTGTPIGRSRSIIVPNVGGFAGLTFRHQDAKVSFGYRADFFFGAMDAGIAARHTADMSFHGPFATISVGLGG